MDFLVAGMAIILTQHVVEDSYDQAVAARLAGDFGLAERLLVGIVDADPGHADAWLQLGLVRSARGEFDAADAAFVRTLDLAPDYADAWTGRARIAFFNGEFAVARRYAERAGETAAASELLARIDAAETEQSGPAWRLDVFGGSGTLTNGLDNWSEFGAAIGYRLDPSTSVTLQGDQARRFGLEDQLYSLRFDRQFGAVATGYVAVGGSADPVFRPEWLFRAGLHSRIDGTSWSTSVDLFHGKYPSGDVQSLTFGFYRDLADGALRLGGRVIGLNDEAGEVRSGYALVGEWQASPPARILFSFTDAPETSEGITLDVQAFTAGLRYQLSDVRAISFTVVHENRPSYDRSAFVAGASWRF